MNILFKSLFTGILSLVFSMAANAGEDPSNGQLRVGGSTTLLPIISKAASDFMEKFETWDKVQSTLPNIPIVVFVSGGGSSFGVKSAINGTVHIGLASRNIKEKEKKVLGKHMIYLIGKDAVVIASNIKNPLAMAKTGFSFGEAAALFSGKHATYRAMDSTMPRDKVVLFVRDSGAGSAEMLQDLVMGDKQVSQNALQLPSQGALLKKLETNTKGIGYISSGLVFGSDKIKAFHLEGVEPTNKNVKNGSYPFVRPLLMVVKGKPGIMAKSFINYVMTAGQEIVADNYYVPAAAVK